MTTVSLLQAHENFRALHRMEIDADEYRDQLEVLGR